MLTPQSRLYLEKTFEYGVEINNPFEHSICHKQTVKLVWNMHNLLSVSSRDAKFDIQRFSLANFWIQFQQLIIFRVQYFTLSIFTLQNIIYIIIYILVVVI
jgi:hypothetical protein